MALLLPQRVAGFVDSKRRSNFCPPAAEVKRAIWRQHLERLDG